MTRTIDGVAPVSGEHYKHARRIEHDHFGQCMWSEVLDGRRIQVECMTLRDTNVLVLVVKHYDKAIPRAGSMKPWPDQVGTYVYLPVDDSNTWDGLDKALTAYKESKRKAELSDDNKKMSAALFGG